MTDRKTEGTFYVDGLLEGPIRSQDDERSVRAFVDEAAGAGLKFHAAVDAGRFSLLADTEMIQIRPGQESADIRMARCLNHFLKGLPSEASMHLMSTLRSVEYIPGHEIQSIYGIKPDGTVAVQQRTVRADTIRPAQPPELRDKLKLAAGVALVLCAAIGISAPFVPYRDFARRLIRQAKPFKAQDLSVDIGPYERFFQIQTVEADGGKGVIWITCEASPLYPATEPEMNELWKASADSASQRLAIEALIRNCLRCEFFDWDGHFRGQQLCHMHWSDDNERQFSIAIPFARYLGRVNVSY